jgi:hypothetical protein
LGAKHDQPKKKKKGNEKTEMEVLRAALDQRQADDSRFWETQLSRNKMEIQPMSIDIVAIS